MTSDVETVRTGIQDVLFVSIIQFGQMVFTAVVMAGATGCCSSWSSAMAPVLWSINSHFRLKLSQLTRAASESFSRVTATLAESVNGIRVTQGFVRQETNAGLFRSAARRPLALQHRAGPDLGDPHAAARAQQPVLRRDSAAVRRLAGVPRHDDDRRRSITFFFLANLFFAPIAIIGNQYNQALVAMAGAERVFRLIDTKPDWEDAPDAVALPDPRRDGAVRDDPRAWHAHALRTACAWSFATSPLATIRRGRCCTRSNFIAEPGQTVALVGHTGSGKSSIINLVAKFYLPTRGELLVDGHEIRTLTSHSLHRQMGMVQQQNFLFSGTVLENIRLSRPEATDARSARRPRGSSTASICSRRCRRDCTPRWASAARAFRSASGSWSVSPARCWRIRGS